MYVVQGYAVYQKLSEPSLNQFEPGRLDVYLKLLYIIAALID